MRGALLRLSPQFVKVDGVSRPCLAWKAKRYIKSKVSATGI
jgi:hypothetical protein